MSENAEKKIRIGILGASGYTGGDLVRLLVRHPFAEIAFMTADRHAGKSMDTVFPHLFGQELPPLISVDEIEWGLVDVDVVFCCLPHGTTQEIVRQILTENETIRVIDLSADFRLDDTDVYAEWYGHEHYATDIQPMAVYGLPEYYRERVAKSRLVANPGCYPTAALLGLLPLVEQGLIDTTDVIIDAKSGVTGAGRGLKENLLFGEVAEGIHPYSVASHRHAPEIEQEIAKHAHGAETHVNFTPHLMPMNRGELCTCYVRMTGGATVADLRRTFEARFAGEPFVSIVPEGVTPATRHVRGSNYCLVGLYQDRIPNRAIVVAVIDNLVKGSSGEAIQNMNLMFGLSELTGLEQAPLFP
ncbi:N-acetyl-gamma-glutamyl-phosphate reductase [Minwuia thermotolerans]|uniref:N-acetyl-gamma-glutamyl-phosphate reductase n=1 Tax=Minwuia thermotolerans TaxID=2056226 RepID=A0A2M9G082_9PROT|nr:N-acetyl-gamma-glutamyl-phosphate reductase [Minwuia thermotolerans]PJK29127.1 N-acetyl-gamma-glutamyl-phosphate reductase [Minwuia thermotolerans]